jgi:hypothetical protein
MSAAIASQRFGRLRISITAQSLGSRLSQERAGREASHPRSPHLGVPGESSRAAGALGAEATSESCSHSFVATTTIVTALARICAIAPNSAT